MEIFLLISIRTLVKICVSNKQVIKSFKYHLKNIHNIRNDETKHQVHVTTKRFILLNEVKERIRRKIQNEHILKSLSGGKVEERHNNKHRRYMYFVY